MKCLVNSENDTRKQFFFVKFESSAKTVGKNELFLENCGEKKHESKKFNLLFPKRAGTFGFADYCFHYFQKFFEKDE